MSSRRTVRRRVGVVAVRHHADGDAVAIDVGDLVDPMLHDALAVGSPTLVTIGLDGTTASTPFLRAMLTSEAVGT